MGRRAIRTETNIHPSCQPAQAPRQIPGLLIPTVEGGLLCHQEMSREAARRGIECPRVVSLSLPSRTAVALAKQLGAGERAAVAAAVASDIERLRLAGATFAAMTANLFHLAFDEIRALCRLPLISIIDVVARHAAQRGLGMVGVLGTLPIMESDLYHKALAAAHIKALTPSARDRQFVNATIFDELLRGVVAPASAQHMERVVRSLQDQGAQAIVLGCTELGMILDDQADLPVLDSTKLLAHAVLERAATAAT